MLFNSSEFYIFLFIVSILFVSVRKTFVVPILLLTSYFFYGYFKYEYTFILIFLSVANFYIVKKMYHKKEYHKYGILVSALLNFSTLFYFKYTNFALENIKPLLEVMGFDIPLIDVLLPIGISFYVFQNFAYTIDVFKDKEPVCNSLLNYLLYVSWFPQLIAGPIERPGNLIPQLETIHMDREGVLPRLAVGLILFSEGFLRKTFGDLIGLTSDTYFSNLGDAVLTDAIFGTLAFGLQIYADFSGYTRMAQGVSWIFGVKLIDNFNIPYIASSFQDFWRRWHISLSTWIRDYLYIPMGGGKHGEIRTFINLLIIMLMVGLWHGASWSFILWGMMHGLFLAVERMMYDKSFYIKTPLFIKRLLLLSLVFLAWIPFRAPTLDEAILAYGSFFEVGYTLPSISFVYSFIGIVLLDLYVYRRSLFNYNIYETRTHAIVLGTMMSAAMWLAVCCTVYIVNSILFTNITENFIYFQF